MNNAKALAELLEIKNPEFRDSCYNGTEIFWFENGEMRIVTVTWNFAYTKNIAGLPGDWQKQDFWFLYLK